MASRLFKFNPITQLIYPFIIIIMAIATIHSAVASSVLLGVAVQLLLLVAPANSISTVDTMGPRDTLTAGKSLSAGEYNLTMQEDCNLVLRRGEKVTWESDTAGKGSDCFLYLQRSGLLLIYQKKGGSSIWTSETVQSSAGARFVFVLQPDGNAVVFGKPVWSTAAMGTTNRVRGRE
ncbi:Mannose-specific lectin 1 [Platanthera guangdongensis]|uniref:Mannose-specific lectin 1 n=1 Tax=Platanthera guangdongensis TaxID=2320717 RepID=A0ABR2M1N9_9ASPA